LRGRSLFTEYKQASLSRGQISPLLSTRLHDSQSKGSGRESRHSLVHHNDFSCLIRIKSPSQSRSSNPHTFEDSGEGVLFSGSLLKTLPVRNIATPILSMLPDSNIDISGHSKFCSRDKKRTEVARTSTCHRIPEHQTQHQSKSTHTKTQISVHQRKRQHSYCLQLLSIITIISYNPIDTETPKRLSLRHCLAT
jgi:hypothetical protein